MTVTANTGNQWKPLFIDVGSTTPWSRPRMPQANIHNLPQLSANTSHQALHDPRHAQGFAVLKFGFEPPVGAPVHSLGL